MLLLTVGPPAQALEFTPAVSIPGTQFTSDHEVDITPSSLGEYIKAVYTFAVYAGSIIAAVVLMIGGFMWLTAGGNVSQVGQAKTYIGGALSGFVLLLLSWTLLQTINPALVRFQPLNIAPVNNVLLNCSSPQLIADADLSAVQTPSVDTSKPASRGHFKTGQLSAARQVALTSVSGRCASPDGRASASCAVRI